MGTLIKFFVAPFFVVGIIFGFIELSFGGGRIWIEDYIARVFGEEVVVGADDE